MALTPDRYKNVDAELQRIYNYLSLLAEEIEALSAKDNLDASSTALIYAAAQVAYAHRLLDLAQKKVQRTSPH